MKNLISSVIVVAFVFSAAPVLADYGTTPSSNSGSSMNNNAAGTVGSAPSVGMNGNMASPAASQAPGVAGSQPIDHADTANAPTPVQSSGSSY